MVATRRTRAREDEMLGEEPTSVATIATSPRKTRSGRARINRSLRSAEDGDLEPRDAEMVSSDAARTQHSKRRGRPAKKATLKKNVIEVTEDVNTIVSTPVRKPLSDLSQSDCRKVSESSLYAHDISRGTSRGANTPARAQHKCDASTPRIAVYTSPVQSSDRGGHIEDHATDTNEFEDNTDLCTSTREEIGPEQGERREETPIDKTSATTELPMEAISPVRFSTLPETSPILDQSQSIPLANATTSEKPCCEEKTSEETTVDVLEVDAESNRNALLSAARYSSCMGTLPSPQPSPIKLSRDIPAALATPAAKLSSPKVPCYLESPLKTTPSIPCTPLVGASLSPTKSLRSSPPESTKAPPRVSFSPLLALPYKTEALLPHPSLLFDNSNSPDRLNTTPRIVTTVLIDGLEVPLPPDEWSPVKAQLAQSSLMIPSSDQARPLSGYDNHIVNESARSLGSSQFDDSESAEREITEDVRDAFSPLRYDISTISEASCAASLDEVSVPVTIAPDIDTAPQNSLEPAVSNSTGTVSSIRTEDSSERTKEMSESSSDVQSPRQRESTFFALTREELPIEEALRCTETTIPMESSELHEAINPERLPVLEESPTLIIADEQPSAPTETPQSAAAVHTAENRGDECTAKAASNLGKTSSVASPVPVLEDDSLVDAIETELDALARNEPSEATVFCDLDMQPEQASAVVDNEPNTLFPTENHVIESCTLITLDAGERIFANEPFVAEPSSPSGGKDLINDTGNMLPEETLRIEHDSDSGSIDSGTIGLSFMEVCLDDDTVVVSPGAIHYVDEVEQREIGTPRRTADEALAFSPVQCDKDSDIQYDEETKGSHTDTTTDAEGAQQKPEERSQPSAISPSVVHLPLLEEPGSCRKSNHDHESQEDPSVHPDLNLSLGGEISTSSITFSPVQLPAGPPQNDGSASHATSANNSFATMSPVHSTSIMESATSILPTTDLLQQSDPNASKVELVLAQAGSVESVPTLPAQNDPVITMQDIDCQETPVKQRKKSASRRQSRRQSYMTATKSAVREREMELRQRTQNEADVQLAAELEAAESLLQEMPGSVERRQTKRRSSSTSRRSPLYLEGIAPRQTRSRTSIELENLSPVVLLKSQPAVQGDLDSCATKIQALFRGWRGRKILREVPMEPNPQHTASDELNQMEIQSLHVNRPEVENENPSGSIDRPSSKEHDINDVFSDFLSKWQSKKSQKAKVEDDIVPGSPLKVAIPTTPRRIPAGCISPKKSEKNVLVAPVPSSATKLTRPTISSSRAIRSRLPAPRAASYSALLNGNNQPADTKKSLPGSELKRSIPIPSKSSIPSLLPSPIKSPIASGTSEVDRKRKESDAKAEPAMRKRPKISARSESAPSVNDSVSIRSKTPPAFAAPRPVTPVTPKRLLCLTPAEVMKTTRSFTSQNRLYRCDFDRVVIKKEIPRPPSPTAKIQAKMASNARTKRRRLMKEKGYTFGAGDEEDYIPKHVTPERKTVKWGEVLEIDLQALPKTSPSKVRKLDQVTPCIAPALLDDYGNLEDNTPLTPKLGKPSTVVITKYLYKGENDD